MNPVFDTLEGPNPFYFLVHKFKVKDNASTARVEEKQ